MPSALVITLVALAPAAVVPGDPPAPVPVTAAAQTTPVATPDDAADDAAIWIDPADPARSVIIGTDKKHGLYLYDLDGQVLQFRADGRMNSVDVRSGFPLAGARVELVAASNRSDSTVALYALDPRSRTLAPLAAIPTGFDEVYGACLYHSSLSGVYYVFACDKNGVVRQWQLDDDAGRPAASLVRTLNVGLQIEGLAADDELRRLYVGEEDLALWQYPAEPRADGLWRRLVDTVGPPGHLAADVEGIAVAPDPTPGAPRGSGWIVVSAQGENRYCVYQRAEPNRFLFTFRIAPGAAIDGAEDTDGLELTTQALSSTFPAGLLVVHDGENSSAPAGNQNFKLVRWNDVLDAARASKP